MLNEETVLTVNHWNSQLFSFTTTRNPAFRFESGQFTMLGLPVDGKPLLRAYSMASANTDEHLEFFSIKVPDGPLTSRLQHLQPGDKVLVSAKPTGTLVVDSLTPGRRLYLLATGTGLAPFLSLVRDPATYERFEHIVLVHCVRFVRDLAYSELLGDVLPGHEFLGEMVRAGLIYYPTVTREHFTHRGRITELLESGRMQADLGLPAFGPGDDRAMICGNPDALADLRIMLAGMGFAEGSNSRPGEFLVEKAFAQA